MKTLRNALFASAAVLLTAAPAFADTATAKDSSRDGFASRFRIDPG